VSAEPDGHTVFYQLLFNQIGQSNCHKTISNSFMIIGLAGLSPFIGFNVQRSTHVILGIAVNVCDVLLMYISMFRLCLWLLKIELMVVSQSRVGEMTSSRSVTC